MDLICRVEVGVIELANECEGADKIGGEVFSVVEEVGDCGLGIWIRRSFSSEDFKLRGHAVMLETGKAPDIHSRPGNLILFAHVELEYQ